MLTKKQQLRHNKKPNAKKVSKQELTDRLKFLLDKGECQICNSLNAVMDYPHHAEFGLAKKDDRTMINICVDCHRHIHTKGFPVHGLTRADTVAIGWSNNEEFLSGKT